MSTEKEQITLKDMNDFLHGIDPFFEWAVSQVTPENGYKEMMSSQEAIRKLLKRFQDVYGDI